MGMFDDLRCLAPLPPDGEILGDAYFQTKDLECVLDRYTIAADGVLLDSENQPLDFHGDVNFYRMLPDNKWQEFKARFTEGKLIKITQVFEEGSQE